jgi:transcriptional regulator with XRE-family HTH domain
MPKSVFTGAHKHLVAVLVEARKEAGMTQAQLAAAVGKNQSFISIIEGSQRRVDVLEFCALARAMNRDPVDMMAELVARLPTDLTI